MSGMNEIKYRRGSIADLNEIKSVTLKAYGQYGNIISAENAKAWEENFENDKTYTDLFKIATCFVAICEEKIVGTAFLIPHGNPYKWFPAEWSYIRLVGVLPEYGGKGIGGKLTGMCVELAKISGEKIVALHTSEFQNAARHIYESMGFTRQLQFELFDKKYWLFTLHLASDNRNEFKFYKAWIEDVDALVEYRIRFAIEISGEQTPKNVEMLRAQMTNYFSKALIDNSCISIIAKWKDQVAGIGSVHLRNMPGNFKNPSGKWGYIMNMYTVPEFRRKGICSEILNRLIKEGEKFGVTAFELHASKEGEPVYKKCGFEPHIEPTMRKIIVA